MTETATPTRTIDPRFASLTEEQRQMLHGYVGDAAALDADIEAQLDRHIGLGRSDSLAGPLLLEFHNAIRDQRDMMFTLRDGFGIDDTGNTLKEKGASLLGAVAGAISKLRSEGLSKALRDDYTAFNLAAISYTMLLTTARAIGSADVASAAERGLSTYARAIQQINHALPAVLVAELGGTSGIVTDPAVADAVRATVDDIWKSTSGAPAGRGV